MVDEQTKDQINTEVAIPINCGHNWKQHPQTKLGYKMNATCKSCGKVKKNIFPATTFEGFIRRWIAGKLTDNIGSKTITQGACGNYQANATELYYYGSGRDVPVGKDVLAVKLPDGRLIGNASKLTRCGSYRRSAEAPAQRVMQELEIPLIPFNVFEEAQLDLHTAKVVVQGQPEELNVPKMIWHNVTGQFEFADLWVEKYGKTKPKASKTIKEIGWYDDWGKKKWQWKEFDKSVLEKRHFIGAMVLMVSGKHYLFDVDRRELKYYRFNAFLSELPKPAKTIAQAYKLLIPNKVKQATAKGKKVLRQGEWFFIPAKLPKPVAASEADHKIGIEEPAPKLFDLPYWNDDRINKDNINSELAKVNTKYHKSHMARIADFRAAYARYLNARKRLARENPKQYAIRGELQAKNNSPNFVTKYLLLPEGQFVSGEVTHSGRQHEPIHLKGWYVAVPNAAINSYTIRGAID